MRPSFHPKVPGEAEPRPGYRSGRRGGEVALRGGVVRMWSAIDQPTTSRVHRAVTVARYSHSSAVGRQVMFPDGFQPGHRRGEVPQNQIRRRRRRAVLSRQRPRLPSRYPDGLTLPRDTSVTLAVHHVPLVPEFPGDPRSPIGSRESVWISRMRRARTSSSSTFSCRASLFWCQV